MAGLRKVFCIGFHKTGTKSIARALEALGYRVTGPNGISDPEIATNAVPMALRLAMQFDAFQDNPWPLLFREMDEAFPRSQFILTVRPTEEWIESALAHFGDKETPMRRWIYGYGCPRGHEATYVSRYEDHNREVVRYFADRPGDLLILDQGVGYSWEALCRFLGKPVPAQPFPHVNSRRERAGRA